MSQPGRSSEGESSRPKRTFLAGKRFHGEKKPDLESAENSREKAGERVGGKTPTIDSEGTFETMDSADIERLTADILQWASNDGYLPTERRKRRSRLQRGKEVMVPWTTQVVLSWLTRALVAYTVSTTDVDDSDLAWLPHWLKTQISKQPKWLFSAIADQDFDENGPDDEALLKSVRGLFDDVWRLCKVGCQWVESDTSGSNSTTGHAGTAQYQNSDEGRDDEGSDDEAIYSEALYSMRMLFCREDSHIDTAEEIEYRHRTPGKTPITIRYITEQLVEEGRLRKCEPIVYRRFGAPLNEYTNKAEALVFALLGWQTMLYHPYFFDLPTGVGLFISLSHRNGGLHDLSTAPCGQIHTNASSGESGHDGCTRPLPNLLAGFGPLIPTTTDWHTGDILEGDKTVASSSFNAHLLSVIGGVNFKWTDCLPCHLDYDIETKTVYLFQYPSFCQHSLYTKRSDNTNMIFHCAATPDDDLGQARFGTSMELRSMFLEVLLSYRLLFGQNKASRKFFLEIYPFKDKLAKERDDTLMELCGSHSSISSSLTRHEEYIFSTHFPVLESRLVPLLRRLSNKRPQTWRQLWKDKRDSASWFTFWAVIIIGGIGIILAFVQVILQAVALGLQYHH